MKAKLPARGNKRTFIHTSRMSNKKKLLGRVSENEKKKKKITETGIQLKARHNAK